VLASVTSGLLNKQSGAALGTAEKTIKVHRAHVMEKMDADSGRFGAYGGIASYGWRILNAPDDSSK
jgi:DNA-binding NarL/FixJ family response regulator